MEIKEAVMLAMTVGAHKIKLVGEKGLPADILEPKAEELVTQAAECKT